MRHLLLPILLAAAGSAPAADIGHHCPTLPQVLQRDLSAVLHEEAEEAELQVRLTLRGARIVDVHTRGGPLRYDRALRRALRWVDCRADSQAEQTVDFTLRLTDPWGRGR